MFQKLGILGNIFNSCFFFIYLKKQYPNGELHCLRECETYVTTGHPKESKGTMSVISEKTFCIAKSKYSLAFLSKYFNHRKRLAVFVDKPQSGCYFSCTDKTFLNVSAVVSRSSRRIRKTGSNVGLCYSSIKTIL